MFLRLFAPVAVCAVCLVPVAATAQGQKGAGVTMAADADAKDIGLPLYPGSRRHVDKDNDSPGLNLDLWGGGSGFKLAVLKLESDDSLDKIAEYYKKRLGKYGKVLDCTHPSPEAGKDNDDSDNSKQLTCGSDKADKGGVLYKSGTKPNQYLVGVEPNPSGHGAIISLAHLAHWQK